MRKLLLLACLVIMGAGVLWPVMAFKPLGEMPGDFTLSQPNFHLYVPLTTCLSGSVVLTLFFWYMRK